MNTLETDTDTGVRTVPNLGPIDRDGRGPWVKSEIGGRIVYWLADTRRRRVVVRTEAGVRFEDVGAVCDMDTVARQAFNPTQMHWIRQDNVAKRIVDKAREVYADQAAIEADEAVTRVIDGWTYEFRPLLGEDRIELYRRRGSDDAERIGHVESMSTTVSGVRLVDRSAHSREFLTQVYAVACFCWGAAKAALPRTAEREQAEGRQ